MDKNNILEVSSSKKAENKSQEIDHENSIIRSNPHEIVNENGRLIVREIKPEVDPLEDPVPMGKYLNFCKPIPIISLNISIVVLCVNLLIPGLGTMIVGCLKHYEIDTTNTDNVITTENNEETEGNSKRKKCCHYFFVGLTQLILIGGIGQICGFTFAMCLIIKARHYHDLRKHRQSTRIAASIDNYPSNNEDIKKQLRNNKANEGNHNNEVEINEKYRV